MYVSGYLYTYNKDGAKAARFSFFDFLNKPALDIHYYECPESTKYRIEFTNVPREIWERFCTVWVGENAYYPYQVGFCANLHKELR